MKAGFAKFYFDHEKWRILTLRALFEVQQKWETVRLYEALCNVAVFHRLPSGSCHGVDFLLTSWHRDTGLVRLSKETPQTVEATPLLRERLQAPARVIKETQQALSYWRRKDERDARWQQIAKRNEEGVLTDREAVQQWADLDAEFQDLAKKRKQARISRKGIST